MLQELILVVVHSSAIFLLVLQNPLKFKQEYLKIFTSTFIYNEIIFLKTILRTTYSNKMSNVFITVQKYRFNRLLTKDRSEVTSLEYK